jgi:hypothetical protein
MPAVLFVRLDRALLGGPEAVNSSLIERERVLHVRPYTFGATCRAGAVGAVMLMTAAKKLLSCEKKQPVLTDPFRHHLVAVDICRFAVIVDKANLAVSRRKPCQ